MITLTGTKSKAKHHKALYKKAHENILHYVRLLSSGLLSPHR